MRILISSKLLVLLKIYNLKLSQRLELNKKLEIEISIHYAKILNLKSQAIPVETKPK